MALDSTDCVTENRTELSRISTENDALGAQTFSVISSHSMADVESDWRQLEALGLESPGQSFDFIRDWIESFAIPAKNQLFVIARVGKRPVAALALHKRRSWCMTVYTAFPGGHVGTNAPLVDTAFMAGLSASERADLWHQVKSELSGAQLAYVCALPAEVSGVKGVFDAFGSRVAGDHLHRSVFSSWEACNAEQRSRSRRKHDKQQGAKLSALGAVTFEAVDTGDDVSEILDVMFRQRSERFAQQGISDPFDDKLVRDFYARAFNSGGDLHGRMHVLRLDGEIVATRYNLMHGSRMFCLISSMSLEPEIQPGSPGKQCLLRVMQTEFDNGTSMFDMGSGMTDEKRHWCNEHIQLYHHYIPLTPIGWLFSVYHRNRQLLKSFLKSNDKVFTSLKSLRARLRGRST